MKIIRWVAALLSVLVLCSCNLSGISEPPVSVQQEESSLRENPFLKTVQFSITEEDIKYVRDCIERCKELYDNGKEDSELFEESLYCMKWALEGIDYQRDLSDLLFDYDMTDVTAKENRRYAQDIYLQLHNEYWSAMAEMQSTAGALSSVLEDFLDREYPHRLTKYFENDSYYLQIESLYEEFCGYNFEGTAEQIHGIYVEYLQAAQMYAESYDYENYYEFQTERTYCRDYGKEQRNQFREYVKRYLVPLYMEYDSRSDEMYYDLGVFGRYSSDLYITKAYDLFGQNYIFLDLDSLPSSIGDRMRGTFEQERIVIGDKPSSLQTACVTLLSNDPVCYVHEDKLDLITVSHELGHYCEDLIYQGNVKKSYDMKEVCSQANSLLMLRYLRDVIDSRPYEAFEVYEISNLLYQTILSTIKDEFDEVVFSDSNAHTYTAEELTAIMENLIVEYGIDEIGGSMVRYAKTYWHRQGIYQPCYQLSYATSAVIALQLYYISENDYATATNQYRLFVETLDMDSSFLGTLENAGLYSPFDEQMYLDFVK